jgi:LAO/AO transport system kinase
MQDHATDDGVFIRSMASRGHLGGLSVAVPQALRALDATGWDVVLIETVGVGQAEFEIAGIADTTAVVLAPGLGDGIQAAKAGILEVADILVVNKADRDGASQLARDLRQVQPLGLPPEGAWSVPILKVIATQESGIAELVSSFADHLEWLRGSGTLAARRNRRAATEIEAIALARIRERFGAVRGSAALDACAGRVAAGETDPFTAADELVAAL